MLAAYLLKLLSDTIEVRNGYRKRLEVGDDSSIARRIRLEGEEFKVFRVMISATAFFKAPSLDMTSPARLVRNLCDFIYLFF